MPMHTGGRSCKCIQCNMKRKGVTPGRRRRVKRVNAPRGKAGPLEYREYGLFIWDGSNRYYWDERLDGRTYSRATLAEKAATKRNAAGEHGGMIVSRPRRLIHESRPGGAKSNPGVTVFRANGPGYNVAAGRRRARVKANPAASRVSSILSRRVYDLSYIHAEEKGQPYRHKFSTGVHCQLLSDGSVRLFRPDGKPIWKNFQ